VHNVS